MRRRCCTVPEEMAGAIRLLNGNYATEKPGHQPAVARKDDSNLPDESAY